MDLGMIVTYITVTAIFIGALWKLFDWYDKKQEMKQTRDLAEKEAISKEKEQSRDVLNAKTTELSLKVSELQIKIVAIEKDIVEIRMQHDRDKVELKKEFLSALSEIKNDNKSEHKEIVEKLIAMSEILQAVSLNFQNHVEYSRKSPQRDKIPKT